MSSRNFTSALFLYSCLASAEVSTQDKNSQAVVSGVENSFSQSSEKHLSEEEKSLAKQWMLKDTDWTKFKTIMSGPRGVWSPGLDPITALGVSETDPEERKRYAELWIKVESRRAELEIAFEVERQAAAKRVLGDQLAINNSASIQEWEEKRKAFQKQILFFVDADCKEDCKALFEEVRASQGDRARLDVFFTGSTSSEDIGEWAQFMKISPEIVRSRKVTLNFDANKSAELGVELSELPAVRVIDLATGNIQKTFKK